MVILILVVIFTVVLFGQIQSNKNVKFTVLGITFTVLGTFGHLYSVILTILTFAAAAIVHVVDVVCNVVSFRTLATVT